LDHEEATLQQHNMRSARKGGGGEESKEEGDGKERRAATGKEDDCNCANVIRSKLNVTIISGLDLDRRISNQLRKNV
jgi:hypothetical protein